MPRLSSGAWSEITSGDGGMGTVRALAGGRILEILVAQRIMRIRAHM
ncbi:MAG TPA: hypothetical protein VF339_15340 [Gammaproteobacteria bacterium]